MVGGCSAGAWIAAAASASLSLRICGGGGGTGAVCAEDVVRNPAGISPRHNAKRKK